MNTDVWDEPIWDELGKRAQDLRILENFIKKAETAPRHLLLRALVEKSRLCAALGREDEVLPGYDQVLSLSKPPADGKEALHAARARINRGSFFRRKGLEADAASEWIRALKDYGNFEDGAVQQVLIKAAVYLELVRQTPREKLLVILLDRWGRSSDRFVQGELVHQILDRSLPWVTPPLGVSWLYFALRGLPRSKELAEGVAAYQLLDVESRKVFWEKAKGLEKKEVLALLANPVFLGLYDWELSLLEKNDQKYPATRWECQGVGEYFQSPEEGVRALSQRTKNLSTWTDGKGRVWTQKEKGEALCYETGGKIRRFFKGADGAILGQFWEKSRNAWLDGGQKGPLNLELNGIWVWACAHFDGGFILGMEKGTVFHLKTNGEVESTNWSSLVSVEGWLGESGDLFRLTSHGELQREVKGSVKVVKLTGETLTSWTGDPQSGRFLVGTEKGASILATWGSGGWKTAKLSQEEDNVLATALGPASWAVGYQKKLWLSRPDFASDLGIPVDGLKAMVMDGSTGEVLWSDSRSRLWRLAPGEKQPRVWWGHQDWPVALEIDGGKVLSGSLEGLVVQWNGPSPVPNQAFGRQAWEDIFWAGNMLVVRGRAFLQFLTLEGQYKAQRFHTFPISAACAWGDLVVSGDEKGQIQIGLAGEVKVSTIPFWAGVVCLVMVSQTRGAAGLESGEVVFFQKKTQTWDVEITWNLGTHRVKDLQVQGDYLLALGGGSALGVWDLVAGAPSGAWLGGHQKPIKHCRPGSNQIFTHGEDNRVLAWDGDGSTFDILSEEKLALDDLVPGYRCVLGRAKEKEIWLWDLPATGSGRKLYGSKGFVTALAVSPDGLLAASGARDRGLRLWKLPEGRTVKKIEGLPEVLSCLRFSPDGRFLAGTGNLGHLWVWAVSVSSGEGGKSQ